LQGFNQKKIWTVPQNSSKNWDLKAAAWISHGKCAVNTSNDPDDVTGMMGIGFGESSPVAGLIEDIYSRW